MKATSTDRTIEALRRARRIAQLRGRPGTIASLVPELSDADARRIYAEETGERAHQGQMPWHVAKCFSTFDLHRKYSMVAGARICLIAAGFDDPTSQIAAFEEVRRIAARTRTAVSDDAFTFDRCFVLHRHVDSARIVRLLRCSSCGSSYIKSLGEPYEFDECHVCKILKFGRGRRVAGGVRRAGERR